MKTPRFLRPVVGVLVACACLIGASPAHAAPSDEQIIAQFQIEAARIQKEIHAAAEDMGKVTELQKELQTLLAEAMRKVGPKTRASLEVSMKVINPLMEGGIAYSAAVQKYMDAGGFDYASANTAELIDKRLEQIGELERLNEALQKRAATLDADMEAVLKASSLSAAEKAGFIKGFQSSTGGRLGAMRAVRTLDARLYAEVRGIYGQLREQLGKWSAKDGELLFEDDAQVAIYNARIEKIQVIAERQEVAQRRALGVE